MRLVPIESLKEDSCIAIDIINNEGKLLLKKGQQISAHAINILKQIGIAYVYITDQYCFNTNSSYSKFDLEHIYTSILTLRNIATKVTTGDTGIAELNSVIETSKTIVETISSLPKDFKIFYEPTKLIVNSFIEKNIYVAMMATALGLKMNLNKQRLINLCLSALLKDLALVSSKFQLENPLNYQKHPILAYHYLKNNYDLDEEVLNCILQHHELFDGSGFPNKLKGDEICLLAQILSVVDYFYELKSDHKPFINCESLFEVKLKKILMKFDMTILSYFIQNTDIFTPDTLIQLNNGDQAVILENNSSNPFRPIIRIIKSQTYKQDTLINLVHIPQLAIKNIIYYIED